MAGSDFSSKWALLVACLWIQSCGGNSYNFALYSATLKEKLDYNQTRLDTLGVAKDVGGNVGILSGILYELLPPWAILWIGAVLNLVGYLGLWLAVTARVAPPPFWAANLLICLGTNGATFFNTAVLVTCLRSFPNSRGLVLGLLKGFIGLSGALFTQMYVALVAPDQTAFLLLIAVVPAGVALLLAPCVRECAPAEGAQEQACETATLLRVYAVSLLLAGLLLGAMLTRELFPGHPRWSLALSSAIFATLLSPICICLSAWCHLKEAEPPEAEALLGSEAAARGESKMCVGPESHQPSTCSPDVNPDRSEDSARIEEEGRAYGAPLGWGSTAERAVGPTRGKDHTLLQALRATDFWLLCASQMTGAGCGLTAINNLAQMGAALGQSSRVSLLVGLVSVWSFLGRMGGGALSEVFVRRKGAPRPLFLMLTQTIMAAGQLVFACALPGSLYVGSVVVGLSYGGQWALMAATASELFGLAHFALLYNVIALGSPIATYLLSARLAGWIYDREAGREPQSEGGADTGAAAVLALNKGPVMGHDSNIKDEAAVRQNMWGARVERLVDDQPLKCEAGVCWDRTGRASPLSSPPKCSGAHCFRLTFLVLTAVCLLGAALGGWLTLRTRRFYRERWEERHVENNEAHGQHEETPAV